MKFLITGGASGLGEAITKKLALSQEDEIFFTYNQSIEKAILIEKEFKNCKGIYCNFQDNKSVQKLISEIEFNNIDVLINNAIGTKITKDYFHKLESSLFQENFQNNILPSIQITQKAISVFRKKKYGKIITILSAALINTPPIGWSEYVAEKAYLASLSKSWAIENKSFNITSNSVSPSFMLTGLNAETDDRVIEGIISEHPLKKLLTIEEVAETVNFLAHCSQQINGTNIIMNAGTDVV